MLPNFRRSEPAEAKPAASTASTTTNNTMVFPSRPYLGSNAPHTPDRTVSVIGSGLTITGDLVSKGEVQIDGGVEGDIQGSNVIVGEGATINGNIRADEVVVRGHMLGTIYARRVMLQATSEVEGDIFHQSISIEQGAMFEGKSRRTADDPRTLAAPSAPAPVTATAAPQISGPVNDVAAHANSSAASAPVANSHAASSSAASASGQSNGAGQSGQARAPVYTASVVAMPPKLPGNSNGAAN